MKRTRRTKIKLGWRWLTALSMALSLVAGILTTDAAKAQSVAPPRSTSALAKYATDLTAAAAQGRFNSIDEKSVETSRAIEILAGESRNNPVILSDSQAVRDIVAVSVARRMAQGEVPESLIGTRLFKLNLEALFHDSKNAPQLVSNLSAIISEVAQSDGKVIFLVDPIQALMGTSGAFDGAATDLLRDAIKTGNVRCFGASTDVAFKEKVAGDESLAALFTTVQADQTFDSAAEQTADSATSSETKNTEEFVGDNVSPDLRELMNSRNAPSHVKAVLQVSDANSAELQKQLAAMGIIITARMSNFRALAVDLPTKAIDKLAANSSTKYVSLDRGVTASGHIENTTGETAMWAQGGNSGFDGSNIGIAIIDSGVTAMGGLDGIVLNQDFTGEGITNDPYGHGTFVASMAATKKGSYGGIAPSAKIINFRVLNSQGNGKLSSVLAALNAVLENRAKYNIRVVNMSLGMTAIDSYKNDALCRAVRSLVNAGIVVVAAAGNEGKDASNPKVYGRIHSPGNEPSAITVGAVNTFGTDVRSDDTITTYSSRGPTRSYWVDNAGAKHHDNLMKPDLAAPGNKIVGNASNNNKLLSSNADLSVPGKPNLMRMSGTSVASPLVAGAAAVLLEANPNLTPNLIKMILMYTAQPLAGSNMLEQGAGELNLEGAVRLARLVRKDLSSSTAVGSSLLTASLPAPQSTIAGQTFTWSQGMVISSSWASGSDLIARYQAIYGQGVLVCDGVLITDGVLVADATKLTRGVLVSDQVIISNGQTMGDGSVLLASGVLSADGVLIANGVLASDGVLSSDGVLASDGVLSSDGILAADGALAADASLAGDKTACMSLE